MEIVASIFGIVITVIGVYIAYLQLKRTPPIKAPEQPTTKPTTQEAFELVNVDVIDEPRSIRNFRMEWLGETDRDIGGYTKVIGSPNEKGIFPIVDIKLRNPTPLPVFVKAIVLTVEIVDVKPDPSKYSAQPLSWEYSVLLDPHKRHDIKTVQISQAIKPNDVDRFMLVIGHKQNYGEFEHVSYKVSMQLQYNSDSSLNLGEIKLKITSPAYFAPKEPIEIRKIKTSRNI